VRDLIITQNITLDGVVANDTSWFSPADEDGDTDDLNEALSRRPTPQTPSSSAARPSRRCAATGRSSSTTPPASPTT
jgi:hypothetical protein